MCERSQFELQLFADNKQRPVEVYWYMPSLQDFQCMLKSQEDIQHKQENIGVHFKAIWNMLTAVASITGVPLDTSNKPEVVIPTHKQSEDEALLHMYLFIALEILIFNIAQAGALVLLQFVRIVLVTRQTVGIF